MEEISNGWFKLPSSILICMYMGIWERGGYCSLTLVVSLAQFSKAKIICNLNLVLFIRKKRMTKGFPVWGHPCVSNPSTEKMGVSFRRTPHKPAGKNIFMKGEDKKPRYSNTLQAYRHKPFCNSVLQLQSVQYPCMSVCVHIYLQKVINLQSSGQLFTKY